MQLALGLGYVIGLTLGLLGGGGSILTVPALVYLVGQTPQVAVTASLMIVGTNSAVGAMFHRSSGNLNWRIALIFGGTGMLTAYFAAGLSKLFAPNVLLIMFALLMLAVAVLMLLRPEKAKNQTSDTERQWWVVIGAGAIVGILTGLLGVGGGFLIVPALVMLVGLPMQQAVGTSLVIIAMNSLAGLLGHLGESAIDWGLISIFAITGILGTFTGTRLADRIPSKYLQRLFAVFIIALGSFLLLDNLL
jgi:uncharacterized membrane protein YfcA